MPYYNRDPKRDHNFDNHPHWGFRILVVVQKNPRRVTGQGLVQQLHEDLSWISLWDSEKCACVGKQKMRALEQTTFRCTEDAILSLESIHSFDGPEQTRMQLSSDVLR